MFTSEYLPSKSANSVHSSLNGTLKDECIRAHLQCPNPDATKSSSSELSCSFPRQNFSLLHLHMIGKWQYNLEQAKRNEVASAHPEHRCDFVSQLWVIFLPIRGRTVNSLRPLCEQDPRVLLQFTGPFVTLLEQPQMASFSPAAKLCSLQRAK